MKISGATSAAGNVGNALSFDGINDYAVATSYVIPPGAKTVLCQAYIRNYGYGQIMTTGHSSIGYGFNFRSGNTGFELYMNKGTSGQHNVSVDFPATQNEWHIIVIAITGDTSKDGVKIYMDGLLVVSATLLAADSHASAQSLSVGRLPSDEQYFNGYIDQMRVYNRVLSDTEIAALYNGGAGC